MYQEQAHVDVDLVQFEHAVNRATQDLQRIVAALARRYLDVFPRAGDPRQLSWRELLEIEEQAFSDLAFQSRNPPVSIDALPRIGPATMPGTDLSGLIDWSQSDPSLPVVYRCVREILFAAPTSEHGTDAV
ncbi:DUF2471 family protein [Burkholderia ubonensis]|uniref:DUF2471 family protein n=1 Tax=Burkholderia ubonensis subsp. mesacidophila TaxID=265293 RepID=A0A2A4FBD4_9BURK|nr:DUF2471 family protein [Burkholderia ubonensis]PCE30337.1 hypothetical protein BZL54_21845 [Burkholderia ubonensis subsp. mesacidophila]